jgi:hypothetical protein
VVAKRKEGQSYREIARDGGAALLALAHRRNNFALVQKEWEKLDWEAVDRMIDSMVPYST